MTTSEKALQRQVLLKRTGGLC